jgi:hypothetical protein
VQARIEFKNPRPQAAPTAKAHPAPVPPQPRLTVIGGNVDPKTIQSRLGHTNFNLALNTYAHPIDANSKQATETFGGLLRRTNKE